MPSDNTSQQSLTVSPLYTGYHDQAGEPTCNCVIRSRFSPQVPKNLLAALRLIVNKFCNNTDNAVCSL